MILKTQMMCINSFKIMTKSNLKSFLRFYKTKLENYNAISEQNLNNLLVDANKFKDIVKEELKIKQNFSFN